MRSLSDFIYPGNEAPPRELPAPAAGVAVWWCGTQASDDAFAVLRSWLSEAERTRAARFGTASLARRYAIGRAALRYVLGGLLGCAPADVPIERGERGRPRLAQGAALDFNVSNTLDVALVGVCATPDRRIGVDVEHAARALRHRGLARKFCTPRELAALDLLDEPAQRRRFIRLWTCKEAMSKATGDALAAPLRRLDVEVEPVLRLVDGPAPYAPGNWSLLDAGAPDDYVATVALWRESGAEGERLTR